MRYFDRSRTIAYRRCPRAAYWGYYFGGTGLTRKGASVPLTTGSAVHAGLETLLNAARSGRPLDEDLAVADALTAYDKVAVGRGFDLDDLTDSTPVQRYTYHEQKALIEALLRAYARTGLLDLLDRYDVLEVEREDVTPLSPSVMWMSRADGLLQEKLTGDLYVLSFKTASTWEQRRANEGRVDMQGLSEAWPIEERLKRRVAGVQMAYLMKGRREADPSGVYVESTPLIRPWRDERALSPDDQWATRFRWTDEDGQRRSLSATRWKRVNVWEEMTVREWVNWLSERQPEFLATSYVHPEPYFRSAEAILNWREQVTNQCRSTAAALAAESLYRDPQERRQWLNANFVQHEHSCNYPSRCSFWDICHGPSYVAEDPLSSGLFSERVPHHEPEAAMLAASVA